MTDANGSELETLKTALRRFVEERDWAQFHDPKNLAMAIASEAGELLSELRWVSNAAADEAVREPSLRDRITQEVGDVLLCILLFCDRTGVDPIAAAERKLAINRMNYPVAASRGHSSRPPYTAPGQQHAEGGG